MPYRIRNWRENFENNRTRELKRMDWVPIPNRMDGEGYTALVDHPNSAAHFGAWVAIVEIASRREERGTLPGSLLNPIPQEGAGIPQEGAGIPQEGAGIPQALARISRLPVSVFVEVLPRLIKLGWLEYYHERVTKIPQEGAGIPQEGAGIPQEGAGIPQEGAGRPSRADTRGYGTEGKERNGTEGNGRQPVAGASPVFPPSQNFAGWWRLWSSVKGTNRKGKAEEIYHHVVYAANELDCIECTQSYLQSLDNPAKGYHPDNFLTEQAKDKFQARWPVSRNRSQGQTIDELAESIDAFRRTRNEM